MSGSTATPIQVLTRPFAVEPVTNIMLPDGIFDNAFANLEISAHFTNQSTTALSNVTIYLEGVSDPGIAVNAETFTFPSIPAGSSILVQWTANFTNAAPGKALVSFIAQAAGFTARRSIQQVFVSQTRFNQATNSYTCTVGEGTLTVSNITVIPSGANWGKNGSGTCCCGKAGPAPPTFYAPFIPVGMTLVWAPGAPYAGLHGDLPFSDPWWKILAIIVAIVAAIVAVVAAAAGSGSVNISLGGTFDETGPTIQCCKPPSDISQGGATVAGVASAICTGAIAVACSDIEDPFFRGQTATPPATGELTTGEQVAVQWTLPNPPNAGEPYTADVSWTYQRFTTGSTYSHSVTETQTNVHVAGNVEVITPSSITAFDPLWVEAKFEKSGGGFFRGKDLYALVAFQAPNNGLYFVENLHDDGLGVDKVANDGIYSASLNLEVARRLLIKNGEDIYGLWRVFVYAQDVDLTAPGTPPVVAAQQIGGMFVASALTITFDPNLPCPLKAQSSIMVI